MGTGCAPGIRLSLWGRSHGQSSGPGRQGGERASAGLAVPTVPGNLSRPPRCRGDSQRAWEGKGDAEHPLREDSG